MHCPLFYPLVHRAHLHITPEPKLWLTRPHPLLALSRGHEHPVAEEVTPGGGFYLGWLAWPRELWAAVKLCPLLIIRVVGDVERLALSHRSAGHVLLVRRGQDRRVGEITGWEVHWVTPGSIGLASRHDSDLISSCSCPWRAPNSRFKQTYFDILKWLLTRCHIQFLQECRSYMDSLLHISSALACLPSD